jgi:hypothetical protein
MFRKIFTAAYFGVLAIFFISSRSGRIYGVRAMTRIRIVLAIVQSALLEGSVTLPTEQLFLVNHLLQLPRDTAGDVAEFGCFKGRTSAILSLACAVVGRRLVIFDSFRGLPRTDHGMQEPVGGLVVRYKEGEYQGTLDEVRINIERFGDISVCEFVEGYFSDTLPGRSSDRWAMIFEDADLPSSIRDILQYAWLRLEKNGVFFCHEARDPEVVRLFFEREWWIKVVGEHPPDFVGSGTGLPLAIGVRYGGGALSFFGSFTGYAVRR